MRYESYVALVGNIDILDGIVVVHREDTVAIDTYWHDKDKAQDAAEQALERLKADGWVIPDLLTIPMVYR